MEAISHPCPSDDVFLFRCSSSSACVIWKIQDFSSLEKQPKCKSPEFTFKGVRWNLSLYPFGDITETSEYVGLFLTPQSSLSSPVLKVQFCVKNETGDNEISEDSVTDFSLGQGKGFSMFLNREDLLDGKLRDCLPFDVLTIYCTIEAVEDLKTEAEISTDTEETPPKSVPKFERDSFLNKFRQPLDSGEFSDVVLRVGEKTIPAHKVILSTSSEVFRAMFKSNLKENQESVVDLIDMDLTVAKAMLLFMYTREVEELSVEKTLELYVVADKYLLTELKEKCRESVLENISLENVGSIFEIAKLHSDVKLEKATKIFFARNVKSILKSKKWEEYSALNLSSSLELVSYAITSNDLFFLK